VCVCSVANAGINRNLPFLDTPYAELEQLVRVNVIGVYHTAQLAARAMVKQGTKGSIILTASMAAGIGIKSQYSSAYCSTKGAIKSMAPPMAAELGKHGVRVNTISPGSGACTLDVCLRPLTTV
jgi:NAD(P)-dependent dehydrogenase (short-subunit alcohol dehydrogenase family)